MCVNRALASSAALVASRGRRKTLGVDSMAAMDRISLEHLRGGGAGQAGGRDRGGRAASHGTGGAGRRGAGHREKDTMGCQALGGTGVGCRVEGVGQGSRVSGVPGAKDFAYYLKWGHSALRL